MEQGMLELSVIVIFLSMCGMMLLIMWKLRGLELEIEKIKGRIVE